MGKPAHPAVHLLSLKYSNLYITYCSLCFPLPTTALNQPATQPEDQPACDFQTSLRWANIHAACPCSAYCLDTQTGHKQDNLIVPRCVPHGSVLSGFADGGLSGVLPPDLLSWWQPGGFIKLQPAWSLHFQSTDCTLNILSIITVSCFLFFVFSELIKLHRILVNLLQLHIH